MRQIRETFKLVYQGSILQVQPLGPLTIAGKRNLGTWHTIMCPNDETVNCASQFQGLVVTGE